MVGFPRAEMSPVTAGVYVMVAVMACCLLLSFLIIDYRERRKEVEDCYSPLCGGRNENYKR